MHTKKYDIFISYADADSAWVERHLINALQQTGEVKLREVRCWLDSSDGEEVGYTKALLELVEVSDRVIQDAKEQEQKTIQREFQLLHKRIYQEQKIRRITSIAALSTAATLLTVTITLLFGGLGWQHQSEPQTDQLYQFSLTPTAFKIDQM